MLTSKKKKKQGASNIYDEDEEKFKYAKDPDPVNGVIPKITASVIVEKRPVFSNSDSDGACAVAKTWKGKPSEINDDTAWQLLSDSSPVDFPALGFKVIETCTNADVGGE